MATTLATKQDLLPLATREDLLATKQDLQLLKQAIDNRYTLLDQKIDTLDLKLTVKVGSMLLVGFGLTIAALRLWVDGA